MDLNLSALIGATYLIPISITLRRVYAPSFDMPAALSLAIARLDARLSSRPVEYAASRRLEMSGAAAF